MEKRGLLKNPPIIGQKVGQNSTGLTKQLEGVGLLAWNRISSTRSVCEGPDSRPRPN